MKSRAPTEKEILHRLRLELGAECAISMREVPTVSTGQQRQVNSKLVSAFRYAIQYMLVPDAQLTVVWPSVPSNSDHALVRRRLISSLGIWESRTNHLWLVPEERDRAVSPDDIAVHLPWFMKAMEVTGCKYMLLLGSRSVWAWRPDLKPVKVNGQLFVWRDTWLVYPMPHPGNLTKREMPEWEAQLSGLNRIIKEDQSILWRLGSSCMNCGNPLYMYDPDGVPWCKDHIQDGLKSQRKAAEKWATLSIHATSGTLFPPGES